MIDRQHGSRWWHHRHSAWLIALASAALVLLSAWSVQQLRWRASEAQLLGASHDLATLLSQRMRGHEQILRGAVGLFDATAHVSRADWQRYVAQLHLAERFPGIQAVGYAEHITADALPAHLAKIRAEGFPTYQVKPTGERANYSAIVYIEPFVDRNLAAFGFDMLAEPTRAAAMQAAARSGNAILTAAVTLMQETRGEVQPGFLMYVPVYRREAALTDDAARNQALLGWVYSAFRAHDLINRMLAESHVDIEFALFDGTDTDPSSALLYRSDHGQTELLPAPWQQSHHYHRQVLSDFGRPWTLITWLPADADPQSGALMVVLLGLGSVISVLLFLLFSALSRRAQQASQIAAEMRHNFQQSETALAASALQARAIIDNVADAILSVHADGLIVQANPAAERLFGYAPQALTGVHLQTLLPTLPVAQLNRLLAESGAPADPIATAAAQQSSPAMTATMTQASVQAADATVPMTTAPITTEPITTAPLQEFEGRRIDGSSVAIEMTLSAIPHAEPKTCIAVCRDVSERRRVDRLKREFVATVSHELRTPLTSITGALDLLVSGQLADAPAAMQNLLKIAQRNSRRLRELINDLLDIEQISRGQLTLFMEDIVVQRKLEETVVAITAYADSLGVHLQMQCDATNLIVNADRKRLRQVLNNLLSNAIKFSPKGGTVAIHCEQHDGLVRITVRDQGPGVPKTFEPRLFEQFSRADSADTRQIGGTGLGLAISKELIERMHGHIGYFPVQPTGACFFIELPQQTPTASAAS